MQRSSRWRRNDSNLLRAGRQQLLPLRIEQSFFAKPDLELLERFEQRTEPSVANSLDAQLKITTSMIQRHQGAHFDPHTICGLPVQILVLFPEHYAADLGLRVLQRKIPVTGGIALQVRNFTGNP